MMRTMAFVGAAAVLASAADTTSPCLFESMGHPTVDFTVLTLGDQDYEVASHTTSGYDYVLNICDNLNYDDDTCVTGSSVCQRHKHTQISTDVYGFVSSMKLTWDDPDANATNSYSLNSTVVMEMTGSACAATGNRTAAASTIVFACSNKEFLMLESEQLDQCKASFIFFTAQACGSPRYTCFNGTKCVESQTYSGEYGTYDKCAAECSAKSDQ